MSPFRISATALKNFYTCPQRYLYYTELEPLQPKPKWLQDGIDAHALMAGETVPKASPEATRHYARLTDLVEIAELRILAREVRQEIKLTRYVNLVRIIDALGYDKYGQPVLMDYKTVNKMWYGRAFETETFQTQVYLLPPEKPKPLSAWPTTMLYLVSSGDGKQQIFPSRKDKDDRENVIHAVGVIRDAAKRGWFPKNRGYNCRYCDFCDACYKAPGWEKLYKERKHGQEGE